jgi:hypothetical protein
MALECWTLPSAGATSWFLFLLPLFSPSPCRPPTDDLYSVYVRYVRCVSSVAHIRVLKVFLSLGAVRPAEGTLRRLCSSYDPPLPAGTVSRQATITISHVTRPSHVSPIQGLAVPHYGALRNPSPAQFRVSHTVCTKVLYHFSESQVDLPPDPTRPFGRAVTWHPEDYWFLT